MTFAPLRPFSTYGYPGVTCDECGEVKRFSNNRVPPRWFVYRTAPRGWLQKLDSDGVRRHQCPTCRKKVTP